MISYLDLCTSVLKPELDLAGRKAQLPAQLLSLFLIRVR